MSKLLRAVLLIGVLAMIGAYPVLLFSGAGETFEWATPLCPVDSQGRYVTYCTSPCRTHSGTVMQGLFIPELAVRAPAGSKVTWP